MTQNPKRNTEAVHLSAPQIATLASIGFPDPSAGGNVTWKTLFSAPETPTDTFTTGIATCKAGTEGSCGGHLQAHRHSAAELYHIISGEGVVAIEGTEHHVGNGSVVYIPGDAEQGVRCEGEEDLVWLYVFAVDGFDEVKYRFDEPCSGLGREGEMRSIQAKL